MRNLIAVAVLAIASAGCAAVNDDGCGVQDWHAVGAADAKAGKPAATLASYENACLQSDGADRAAYHAGWDAGLAAYCTPHNGFAEGQRGVAYSEICPEASREAFEAGHERGRELHLALIEIRGLEADKSDKQRELEHLSAHDPHLWAQPDEVEARVGALRREIDQLVRRIALKRDRYQLLSNALAYRGPF